MARAPGARALGERRAPISGKANSPSLGLSGHARLLAQPAYERLLTAEPHLRRLIPIMIVIFLAFIAMARVTQLYEMHTERGEHARAMIDMVTTVVGTRLAAAEAGLPQARYRIALQNALADALPPSATDDGRRVLITDRDGIVTITAPRMVGAEGMALNDLIADAQPLTIFGDRAGVMTVQLPEEREALAALHHLPGRLGAVAVLQPLDQVFDSWRRDVSLNVSVFVGTSGILLVILYGYFTQSARAQEADRIYSETHDRLDMALLRGRCGLWDWDLPNGRLFWSKSMFEILGYQPRDTLLGFGEVNGLLHPEDGDLMALVETLYETGETTVDRMFRMRSADGEWVWLRARAELVAQKDGEPHLIGIAVDVSEQMRQAERSRTADLRLRDAIDTISEAFVLWDADNRLVMCNSKYQQLHGLSDTQVQPGSAYNEVMGEARQPIVRAHHPSPDGSPDGAGRSFEAQIEDGRWLQISERRTKDGGFVSVGTDITQIKRHEARLIEGEQRLVGTIADLRQSRQKMELQAQQMVELAEKYAEEKDRAEEANRTKSEFLANISHELRTPLNAVIGFSEIMQSGMFGTLGSPKYAEYCNDIHESGTYLLGVINDILDMSRIEAGRMTLDVETLALDHLVEESLRVVTGQAESRRITVTAEVAPDLWLSGDRRALKQILLNLLSNAVKFTPADGRIAVRARQIGGEIRVSIGDSGIGIPRDALLKLGRPFEQVQNQFTKSHRGSGLGLAITRSLIELHGGTMRIRSREGDGTVVSLRLPVDGRPVDAAA